MYYVYDIMVHHQGFISLIILQNVQALKEYVKKKIRQFKKIIAKINLAIHRINVLSNRFKLKK